MTALVILTTCNRGPEPIDKRITLHRSYKAPYGTSALYDQLPNYFPKASVTINRESPDDWENFDSLSEQGKSVMFILSRHFDPTDSELYTLFKFVEKGNIVFICSAEFSDSSNSFFYLTQHIPLSINMFDYGMKNDSTTARLGLALTTDTSYFNPGNSLPAYFIPNDTLAFSALGYNNERRINFGRMGAGKGFFYFHTDPFLFANYFLLYKNNHRYLDNIMKAIPDSMNNIIWDDYFVYSLSSMKSEEKSPFRALYDNPAFKAAFILALILASIYILLHVKRLQRIIPPYARPRNESLDFIKTIGRLYHQQGDHTDLANKMSVYILDHIRSKYYLSTTDLNDEFIQRLSGKTGYDPGKLTELVSIVANIRSGAKISEKELARTYTIFNNFYKHIS